MYYNPYRLAASIFFNKLKWDLNPKSFESRRKIGKLKDKFKDKKAVIVCNGPSLLKSDLSLLDDVFTFGLNKINLLFDKTKFRPSCIVSVNNFVIEQNKDFFNSTEIPLFLNFPSKNIIHYRKNVNYLYSCTYRGFSENANNAIYQGNTVTFVAMQLAFYFGFKEVALIGCDHNFQTKGEANKVVVSGHEDPNHFDKNYFAGGVKWQLPDLPESEAAYIKARDTFEKNNKKIFNCTVGGNLEVFERKPLKSFIIE